MSASTTSLFEPIQLGPITLKNRIFISAMGRNRSVPTNIPNALNVEYYRQRAAGGAGLIISEGTLITQQGYVAFVHCPTRTQLTKFQD